MAEAVLQRVHTILYKPLYLYHLGKVLKYITVHALLKLTYQDVTKLLLVILVADNSEVRLGNNHIRVRT